MISSNFFKSFDKIWEETPPIKDRLSEHQIYFAHLHSQKKPELLFEHTNTVAECFLKIMKAHHLETIVHQLIMPLLRSDIINSQEIVGKYIKKLFFQAIIFHDYGKVNENFQIEKMSNSHFHVKRKNKIGSTHSQLSAFLYIVEHLKEILESPEFDNETKSILYVLTFLFSNSITKHHAPYIENSLNFDEESVFAMKPYLEKYSIECDDDLLRIFFKLNNSDNDPHPIKSIINEIYRHYIQKQCNFPIYALVKLNYSLLTASDYYGTISYTLDLCVKDFGTLSIEDKEKFFTRFQTTREYNRDLFQKKQYYTEFPDKSLNVCSPENLNILRKKLLAEVIDTVEKNMDKNVFFLEAPTGSGKTNLSLAAALTLLKSSPDINKIYYVFPFTTLITQTAEAIEKTLGITREQMIQLHSRSGFNEKNEEKEDGLYKNRLNYIDNLFVNYPVTLLTHIKFFDILKGNSKETNYLIHRLANSIVIIDEVQSYPPKEWDKITYFIGKFADYFNIKFIVMSATLPKLDTLHIETINQHFTPLIKDKYRYFQNPNFKNRVNFDFTLLEEKNLDIETLADFVYEKCEKYAENNVGTVKAIIEFIFKKTASKFYNLIYEKAESAGYELYLLSGTILEPRRKEIIQLIKTSEQKEINKILLISTQVVEAGVDIDMNIGFKDKSLIDSDEQLAGRVNRNAAPNPATVYIFNLDRAFSIYGKDYRYKITRDLIDHHQYQNILAYKDFDKLYHKVIDKINKDNKNIDLVNFDDYIKYIRDLEFFNIDKDFKLINEHTESVFVPLRIPINCFSKSDLMFLKEFNCQNGGDHVNGENVWEAYEGIITSKDKNFINKRIDLKKIYGIMAQFMFSIYGKSEQLIELIRYAKDRPQNTFGIIYLLHWEDVYDYKSGIKDNKFEEAIFL